MNNIFNCVALSHDLIENSLRSGMIAIDATCGNGHDMLFLAKLVGETGYVYGFDIQLKAINNTDERLKQNDITHYKLFQDSHANISKHIKKSIDCCVFNLGYLPSSKSKTTTKASVTVRAVKTSIKLLNKKGVIVICAYVSHAGGRREYRHILKYCKRLDRRNFQIMVFDQPNSGDFAPKVLFIRKKVDF